MVSGDQPTEGKHIDFQERSQASGRGDVYTGFFLKDGRSVKLITRKE